MLENMINSDGTSKQVVVETEKYLSFMIDKSEYAVSIQYVTDIIKLLPITFLPNIPDYIKGIINLRGKIVPVMDMRMRFGKEEIEYTDAACIIVMEYNNISVGILVDEVAEVADVAIKKIMSPPKQGHSDYNKFVKGISKQGSKIFLLIDCTQLFDIENL